ncbi:hypothetical protein [Vibrio apostichopi]|uniref:hypothetical protein n=1 Tax=Vibrio apostichopi TaxID=3035453 RepID=UPI00257268A1|nr:hypothetical protein [Vibrio sp. FE10]
MEKLSKIDILEKIGGIYKDKLQNEEYEVIEMDPLDLISEDRLDIVLKLLSIPRIIGVNNSEYLFEIYKKHIRCITENTFSENGSTTKLSLDDFKSEFKQVCESISENGFNDTLSLIPVDGNSSPINGAHRVAAAIYYKVKVKVVIIPELSAKYDAEFFRKRGLCEDIIEHAFCRLVEISRKYVCGLTWPASKITDTTINSVIEDICYLKSFNINERGMHNIICEAYSSEQWLGTPENSYKGAWKKALPCLGDKKNKIVNFFIMKVGNNDLVEIKENIRQEFGIGKHSVHICDDNFDSLRLSRYILNPHFIKIVNKASHYRYSTFIDKLEKLKMEIGNKAIPGDQLLLDGSTLLGVLGLREPNDLDFLSSSDFQLKCADSHNRYLYLYQNNMDELQGNPSNYVYFYGLKFIGILPLIDFKRNRSEAKDNIDISLIKGFGENNLYSKFMVFFKSKFYFTKLKVRNFTVKLITLFGLKNILKSIIK